MATLTVQQAQEMIDSASDQQLMYVAVHMAGHAKRLYNDGDCCPLCGYDAYWNCDSAKESVLRTYLMLERSLKAGRSTGYSLLRAYA